MSVTTADTPRPRRSRARRVLVGLGVSLLAAALALAATELWLRLFLPIGAPVQDPDPVLLSRPIPGARSVLVMNEVHGGRRVPLRINASGFRGPPLDELDADLRIAVYGDSFVMAENVREEDTFVARLAAELAERRAEPVDWLNAGVSGYGPDQSLLRLQQEIDEIDADLVVLVFCSTNDFGDLVRNKLFTLDADGGLVQNQVTLAPKLLAELDRRRRKAERLVTIRAFEAVLRSRTERPRDIAEGHPLNPLIPLYLRTARDAWAETVQEGSREVTNLFVDVYDADVAIHPGSESARYKTSLMAALIERWRATCASRGVPLFAVVVPSAVDLDPTFQIRVDPALYPTYDANRLCDALTQLLASAAVPHLDLRPTYTAADPTTVFEGYLDMHWNAKGQALAARAAADAIEQAGLLAP